MLRLLPVLALFVLLAPVLAEDEELDFLPPYEDGTGFEPATIVDVCALAGWQEHGIEPSNPCSDEVFLRRVYVDLIGTLPETDDVQRFLFDLRPDKRMRLVDALMAREEFFDYWSLKWGDLLRVKAEFPIKLWPNGVQAYHRWIRDSIKANKPYDVFARELLTSSGSDFRVGPVNFYRGVQDRSPTGLAAAVALTLMGSRFDAWPPERRTGMAAFFTRVRYKPTAEWKEEIVIHDPAPAGPLEAVFPDGTPVTIPALEDPRVVFADWLLASDNPYFARNIANRAWSWFLGRGIVHEPDDIRPENPPSNPALLTCLEREFVKSGYDMQALFRLIVSSRTYQGSPVPRSNHPQAEALFAYYKVRRLDAEVLIDALVRLDGRGASYLSIVPEPFTIIPNMQRTITLKDGTITSPFLEMFGRPSRDTGLESERDNGPTAAQRLHFLNSTDVQRRIERSAWLRRIVSRTGRNKLAAIRPIYLALLARDPSPGELAEAAAYFGEKGRDARVAAVDLAWALLNSKEFLYRH